MMTFKCKMCGGDLTFEQGASVAECPYCGTKQTLPKLDDDKRANLYDRANHFRRQNEYDKAMAIYEQILAEDRADAEAYWSLVLCRYGIEYVEDPASRKRVPTVNRVQFTSILADEDYKSALQYADAQQRGVYEAEASAIAEIQKGILDISNQEEPFDVFICYKETDANGRRTPDSVLATELYHELTKEGFKVFFSRITLEDKIGSAYEPYIFAALNSAKVMVALGTKPEHFNAVWVKNEWSRYLALIRAGADKTLVPAYRDMDPYDLPEEFAHLQAQDMGKLGFMQDLTRGIKKILHKDEPQPQTAAQPAAAPVSNAAPLVRRAFMSLEDGDFAKADDFCEQALNLDPENARAWLGKLMAELKVRREEDLKDQPQPFDNNSHYQKAMRFGDKAMQAQLKGDITHINERNEHGRQKGIFDRAKEMLRQAENVNQCFEAMEQFKTIPDFEGVKEQIEACSAKIESINAADYQKACDWQAAGKWQEAIRVFELLGDYRDSRKQAALCQKAQEEARRAEEERVRREREKEAIEQKKRRKRNARIGIIVGAVAVLAIAAVMVFTNVIKPNMDYNAAMAAMQAGEYDRATEMFEQLGAKGYKDAATQALESQYQKGMALMEAGQYDEAEDTFTTIGEFGDAASRVSQVQAEKLYVAGNYTAAYTVYKTLDSSYNQHAEEYADMYAQAEALIADGEYDSATEAFEQISTYEDAADKAKESQYQKGMALMASGDYDDATAVFQGISDYNDAATQALESQYQKGMALMASGDYDDATSVFQGISDYNDAATQSMESQYQKAAALNEAGQYDEAFAVYEDLIGYRDVDSIIDNDDNIAAAAAAAAAWRAQFETGNTVTYGRYEQDNDTANGAEAIEWIVLANDGETATLISKYGLDVKPYNTERTDVTWEICTLRKWLNGEFLNAAFSAEERSKLETVTVTADKNPSYSTNPGKDTQDTVFLLSIAEANVLLGGDDARKCQATAYATAQGAYVRDNCNSWWWLRSPGYNSDYAAFVLGYGSVRIYGDRVDYGDCAVRPVIVLRLK